jgi:hypothetical protein
VLGVRNEDVMGFLDSYVKEYTVDSSLFATSLAISIEVISRNSEVYCERLAYGLLIRRL